MDDLRFTDNFRAISRRRLGVEYPDVREVLAKPTSSHTLDSPGSTIELFVGAPPRTPDRYLYLPVVREGRWRDVQTALPFRKDLLPAATSLQPVAVLNELAQRFGADVEVGGQRRKLILDEVIDLPGGVPQRPHPGG